MSSKSFSNELHRARARPDIGELLLDLEDYHQMIGEVLGRGTYEVVDGGNHCNVMDAHRDDPERGLSYVALAMATYDDREFLGVMAAGPLEDLLQDPTPELLDRIVAEARKTPRFRWMLSGVWLHAIAERVRGSIENAVGSSRLEQPLPEPPF